MDACRQYSWPGNLRELEAFVTRYLVLGGTEAPFEESRTKLHEVKTRYTEFTSPPNVSVAALPAVHSHNAVGPLSSGFSWRVSRWKPSKLQLLLP